MTHDLTEPTLGYIVTPITWDGTNFHPLLSTVAGLLQVSVEAATEIVTHCMGLDGAAWVGVHVDAQGDVQTDVLTIADGQIRCYGWTGAAWQKLKVSGAGLVENAIQTIVEGQVRGYLYDGGGWQRVKGLASGIAQVDIDSLRTHTDVIPMHFHSVWRERFSYTVDAGRDFTQTSVVAAGFVAVLTNMNMWTNNAATTVIVASARGGPDITFLVRDGAPAANVPFSWTGELWLAAGDYVRADPTTCPIGGIVYLDVNAYLMRAP